MNDRELSARLSAIEARAPGRDDPPAIPARRRQARFALSITAAPVLLLAVVATATAGAAVVASNLARSHPGIQNEGQPLAGAEMECMTPPQAEAFLAAHGFTVVVWQIEAGDGGKGQTTSVQQATAPEHGYVVPGSILDDGSVIMVVDQSLGASGTGACVDLPMP